MLVNVKSHKRKGKKVRAHKRRTKVLSHGRVKARNKRKKKALEYALGHLSPDYGEAIDLLDRHEPNWDDHPKYVNALKEFAIRYGRKNMGAKEFVKAVKDASKSRIYGVKKLSSLNSGR